jgi:pSer/pThr/pTyr-binding forkhead associated (FHA) protein/V8-like Glu-specific endopeptidase
VHHIVKCEFRIVSGGRSGHREVFDKSYIGCGRHPLSDLRFDAEKDLDVSTRHAAVVRTGDRWVLRDLNSRNGSFVNGRKIEADYELSDGDVLRFGVQGPEVEFHEVREGAEQILTAVKAPPAERTAAAAKPAPAPAPAAPAAKGPSATTLLRAQVSAQAARFRALMIVLAIIVVGAAAVLIWQGRTAQQQVSSLGTALDSLSRELRALRVAQTRADSEAAALRGQIAEARSARQRDSLQQSLAAVQQRQRGITAAQGVDWGAINRANARAVAMIYVQFPDDSVFTGTGFAVTPDGLLLTNRHVVLGHTGERPARIAVQFSGSTDVLHARIEKIAPDADIATVRITDAGTYPVVQGLRPDPAGVEVGDPIALIGYPLGLDTPMGTTTVNSTLAPGTIGKILPDSLLQLDAYSGTGASGSPILDRTGQVIGLEFGGLRESGGRIVLGLPIRRAVALLGSNPPSARE